MCFTFTILQTFKSLRGGHTVNFYHVEPGDSKNREVTNNEYPERGYIDPFVLSNKVLALVCLWKKIQKVLSVAEEGPSAHNVAHLFSHL